MKKEEFNIDKAFREKLSGFTEVPPAYVWDNIQGKMANLKQKKQRMLVGWIAAAAVIVMAFLAGWYFNDSSKRADEMFAQQEVPVKADETQIKENEINTVPNDFSENNASITNNEIPANEAPKIITQTEKNQLAENRSLLATEKITQNQSDRQQKRQAGSLLLLENIKAAFNAPENENRLAQKKNKPNSFLSDWDKTLIANNTLDLNREQSNISPDGWKIGVYASPGYSSYQANHNENYSQNMTYSSSEGNTNVGGGFSVQYKTSKKWSVESGVYYAKNGQNAQRSLQLFALNNSYDYALAEEAPRKSFFGNAVNVQNGEMLMNSTAGIIAIKETPKGAEISNDFEALRGDYSNTLISDGDFSQVFDFIEIPVYLRYHLVDSKIGVEVLGGFNASVVVGNNAYIDNEYGVQNIGKTQEIAPVNISGTLGVGVNYALGKKLSVSVEPRVNYYLNSLNTNPDIDFRPYRIGVYTGLNYEF